MQRKGRKLKGFNMMRSFCKYRDLSIKVFCSGDRSAMDRGLYLFDFYTLVPLTERPMAQPPAAKCDF